MQKRLNDQQKIELVEKYNSGEFTCRDLSKQYGITSQAISGLLNRRGIKVNNNQSELQRKYTLNEDYFDYIDTEEKAYFLGLLYADGYNNEQRGTIILSLIDTDKTILDKFNKELLSNKPLQIIKRRCKNPNWADNYRLSIVSQKMSKRLKELGCPQKKSFIIEFPNENIISNKLLRHFVRGYFDGDGSFSTYLIKNKYKSYNFCIVSTLNFCEHLTNIIKNMLGINCSLEIRHKNRNNSTRQLRIAGRKQIYKFLDWIYSGSTISINRKYQKYLQEKIV